MRTFLILAFAAFVTSQFACQQGGETTTKFGNRVINHTNKPGPKPAYGQTVLINLKTWINDSLVQSSLRDFGGPREVTIPDSVMLKDRVPAVFDALLLMAKGDSATAYQPVDSLTARGIPASFGEVKEIRFDIVLEDIVSSEMVQQRAEEERKKMEEQQQKMEAMRPIVEKANAEAKKRFGGVTVMAKAKAKEYSSGKLDGKLTTTASGLKVLIVDKGSGEPVQKGEQTFIHYYGLLTNGNTFDNSFERGQALPVMAASGQVIPGFDEGVMLLNHGGKAYLFISPELGYGAQPQGDKIPANSELIFYIELL
jgi:FKBP-type peptidyl-prolyl cis-trans isomerase